jgi:hypothetical protein
MIDASIYLAYSVAGVILTTIISSLLYFNKKSIIKKICKEKEIVLQAEEIIPTPAPSPPSIATQSAIQLILEVNNNDDSQWPIIN